MRIETFELERTQSLWENTVEYNLTETGVHPFTLRELLSESEIADLLDLRIGYGQTNGSHELRDAIATMYPGTDRDNVLVTSGSIEANFVSIWSLLEPGDEMVLMLPNYMQLWGLGRSFGIDVKPFYLQENLDWQPDYDAVRALLTPKTRMIAVCNPNNPTGAVLTTTGMQTLVDLVAECDAWLYADEIYRGAELSGEETPSFYGMYEKTIVTGGLSKSYALPGTRIGWLVGPKAAIAECWARRDYTSIATSILSNRIATLALQPELRQRILDRNRGMLRANLALLQDWLAGHDDRFHLIPPRAGGMAFFSYDMDINSTELCRRLRKEKSTFLVAGDCFGMDRYLRVGIGSETSYLQEGLRRVDGFLAGPSVRAT